MNFRRSASPGCMLFLCFILLLGCTDPEAQKQKSFSKALEYIKKNDNQAAIIELKNSIQIDAKFAEARYQLGLLYLSTGNSQEALEELQRVVSLDPQNLDAGTKVAEFYLLSRKNEESRKYLNQVLSIDPGYLDGLTLLANLELIEGNFEKAEEVISKALETAPDNDKLYNIQGRMLVAQEKWQEGEEAFRKAIQLNPDYYPNYQTLLMYYGQREDESALQALLKEIESRFTGNAQMYIALADFYQKKGNVDETEKALLQAIDSDQESAPLRLMLAKFYQQHNHFDKAEGILKSSLSEFPQDLRLQFALADILFDRQKFDEAQTLMDKLLATNPNNGGGNLLKSRFLIRDEKNDEAIEILTPLMADYPEWADPFYYSALAHLRIGKPELAQKAVELALQNAPSNDRYHALAAQIHLILGNSGEAVNEATIALRINQRNFIAVKILTKSLVQGKEYDKAIQLIGGLNKDVLSNDVELLGNLGISYLRTDKKAEARETFARLLELAPDNTRALAYLTTLSTDNNTEKSIDFVKNHIDSSEFGGHYILLGELYVKNKEFDKALKAYDRAQILSPENPRGYILGARLLTTLGRADDALAKYQELLRTQPNSIAGIMGLATAHEGQGNIAEAKAGYMRALELQPNLPAAANNLAWLLASEDNGDLGEALRLAMQAKQALPDQPHITDTLGWVHYKRKSYALAISQFRQALEQIGDDPVVKYHLALALHANGETDEGKEWLEKAVTSELPFKERKDAEMKLAEWEKQ